MPSLNDFYDALLSFGLDSSDLGLRKESSSPPSCLESVDGQDWDHLTAVCLSDWLRVLATILNADISARL